MKKVKQAKKRGSALILVGWIYMIFFPLSGEAFSNAVSQSLANAGTANIDMSASPHLNPAVLPYFKGYHFSSFLGQESLEESNLERSSYNINLTDHLKDTLVPTSFGYQQITTKAKQQQDNNFVQKRFQLSIGNFLSRTLSMVFGISYYHAEDQTEHIDTAHTQTLLNTGLLWAFKRNVGLALSVHNIPTRPMAVVSKMNLSQRTTLGVGYLYRQFIRLRADLSSNSQQNWSQPLASLGVENLINSWIAIRFGYQKDQELNDSLYSAGVGFFGPQFSIHYAYQAHVERTGMMQNAIDFSFPLW